MAYKYRKGTSNFLIEDKILELTAEWYRYANLAHHKDRDCHFYITIRWSYGQPPVYTLEHKGYIFEGWTEEFFTYEAALKGLYNMIREGWLDRNEWADAVLSSTDEDEWDEEQKEMSKFIKRVVAQYDLLD